MKLSSLLAELRIVVASFVPWGAVAGAHSYPGPEPGRVVPAGQRLIVPDEDDEDEDEGPRREKMGR